MALNKTTSHYREMSYSRRRFEQEQHDKHQAQRRAEVEAAKQKKPRG